MYLPIGGKGRFDEQNNIDYSEVLEEAGFFKYIASLAAKKAGKRQLTLFIIFNFY